MVAVVDTEDNKCPECGEELVVTDMMLNGIPIKEVKCKNCNYMRLID